MSKFLKLSSVIINTRQINHIIIKSNKYYISLMSSNISGGIAYFSSNDYEIKICANKNPIDYKILQDWIENQDIITPSK